MERKKIYLEAPLDAMNGETDSARGDFFGDSNSAETVVLGGRLAKSIHVPTFAAEMIHGPQGSTLQTIKIVTGCVDVVMDINS